MNIHDFFTDILNARPRNRRWSWGAVDTTTGRVFLQVWQDNIETRKDGERIRIASDEPRLESQRKHGFAERNEHLDLMRNGAEGFGVLCRAVDPETKGVRAIANFDATTLLRLGAITKETHDFFARIDGRVLVEDVLRQRPPHSTLIEDLKSIEEQKIESTTKDALVSARVGQGAFRLQVLERWGNCCSVTRSLTLDAISAAHIKPWKESSDQERLDPDNGLPLVASLHALFDAGLVSFEASGKMLVSSKLSDEERQIFGIGEESLAKRPTAKTAKYLAYHRKTVFRR
jgi:hypothetical protein